MDAVEILVKCRKCQQENVLTIAKGNVQSHACIKCGDKLLEYVPVNGYLYILSNPKYQNLLKIGFTKRSVEERVKELNAPTGVPHPFTIEAYFLSETPEVHEKEIHNRLSSYRIESKEFFEVSILEALTSIEIICGRPPSYLSPTLKAQQEEKKEENRREKERREWENREWERMIQTSRKKYQDAAAQRLREWQERVYKKDQSR